MGNGQSQASNDLSNIGNSIRTGLAGFGGLVNRGVIAPISTPILTNLGAGLTGLGNDLTGAGKKAGNFLARAPSNVGAGLTGLGNDLTGAGKKAGNFLAQVPPNVGAGLTGLGHDLTGPGKKIAGTIRPFFMGAEAGAAEAEKLSGFSELEKSIDDIRNDPRNADAYGSLILSMNDLHDTIDNMHEVLKFIENMKESGGDPRKLARLMAEDGVKPLEDVAGSEEEEWWVGYASGFAGLEEAEHPENVAPLGPHTPQKKLPSSGEKSGAGKKNVAPTGQNIPTLPSGVKELPIVKALPTTHFPDLLMASDPHQEDTGVYSSKKKHHLHGHPYPAHHETPRQTHPDYVKHIPKLHS
jgi:hypothetical protein